MNTNDKENKIKMPSEFEISYSYEGGYTVSYESSLPTKITVNQDGDVTMEHGTNFGSEEFGIKPKPAYNVDKSQAIDLIKFFYENKFYDLPEDLSDDSWCDATSDYLEVKSNTFNRKVGGYAAFENDIFRKFQKRFYKIINRDLLEQSKKNEY